MASLTPLSSLAVCGSLNRSRPCCSLQTALRALTGLTRLSVEQWYVTNTDLAACSGLVYLQQLRLVDVPRVTAAAIQHLCCLTRMSYLELCGPRQVAQLSREEAWAQLNTVRREYGWPPLVIQCLRDLR